MFSSLLSFVSLGLLLIVAALVVGLIMALAARKPGSNVVVASGAAKKLVSIAMTGNVDAVVAAAIDSFHLHFAAGSLPEKLLQAGFAEVQRNVSDPNGKTPLIDAIANFTGKTRQQVFDTFKAELDGPAAPATPAPVTAAAAAVLLLFALPSFAADTWGMPVKGPQRFYESHSPLRVDPPLMRDQRGQLVEYQPVAYVRYAKGDTSPIQPPDGSYYQPVYACQSNYVGFWDRGPARRVARGAARVVTAPFRLVGRLFRRCG